MFNMESSPSQYIPFNKEIHEFILESFNHYITQCAKYGIDIVLDGGNISLTNKLSAWHEKVSQCVSTSRWDEDGRELMFECDFTEDIVRCRFGRGDIGANVLSTLLRKCGGSVDQSDDGVITVSNLLPYDIRLSCVKLVTDINMIPIDRWLEEKNGNIYMAFGDKDNHINFVAKFQAVGMDAENFLVAYEGLSGAFNDVIETVRDSDALSYVSKMCGSRANELEIEISPKVLRFLVMINRKGKGEATSFTAVE